MSNPLFDIAGSGTFSCEEVSSTPPPEVINISIVSSVELSGLGGTGGTVSGVSSVNGKTGTDGAVVLNSDDISEGSINLYATTANVDAAGAVMSSDTEVSSASWVIAEGDLATSSASKVPTQASVKEYVDSQIPVGPFVSSVNGDSGTNGAVVLDSDNIAEGSINLYATTANVNSAGAVMSSDTEVSSASWVIAEGDLATSSATKVPTQASVKEYVDSQIPVVNPNLSLTDYKVTVGPATFTTPLTLPLVLPPSCDVSAVRVGCTRSTAGSTSSTYWEFKLVKDTVTELAASAFNTYDNSELSLGAFVPLIVDQNNSFDGSQTLAVIITVVNDGGNPTSLNSHNLTFQVEYYT